MDDWIDNLTDKELLQDNLTFAAVYIAMYENMTNYVVSYIRDFLCDIGVKDGKIYSRKTEEYITEISKRIVDDKGSKNQTKASFLWLVDNGAITQSDYKKFLKIKKIRNKYAHELDNVIIMGVNNEEISLLFDMFALYSKITRWFFTEIEASICGYSIPENEEDIQSGATAIFGIVLNVLYNAKSEEFKEIVVSIKEGYKNEI